MPRKALFLLPLTALALSGCLAKTVIDVATAPVRIAGNAADLATVSKAEREAQMDRLKHRYSEQIEDCGNGKMAACDKADKTRKEMEKLRGIS